jgi:hypothetical protein
MTQPPILTTDYIIRQDGAEFRAPDAATLLQWAQQGRIRADSQVFDPTLNRWSRARDLPALASAYQSQQDLSALARNYRSLVLGVGAQLLLGAVYRTMPETVLFVGPALLATIVALMYFAYKTAQALGSPYGALWAVAMLVPCLNILTLLVLSSKATAVCRANGIPVGFLGPKI